MIDKIASLLMDVGCQYPRSAAQYMLDNNTVVFPCKIGDTCYRILKNKHTHKKRIIETKVTRIAIDKDRVLVFCECTPATGSAVGHLVYMTREAAERSLRGQDFE